MGLLYKIQGEMRPLFEKSVRRLNEFLRHELETRPALPNNLPLDHLETFNLTRVRITEYFITLTANTLFFQDILFRHTSAYSQTFRELAIEDVTRQKIIDKDGVVRKVGHNFGAFEPASISKVMKDFINANERQGVIPPNHLLVAVQHIAGKQWEKFVTEASISDRFIDAIENFIRSDDRATGILSSLEGGKPVNLSFREKPGSEGELKDPDELYIRKQTRNVFGMQREEEREERDLDVDDQITETKNAPRNTILHNPEGFAGAFPLAGEKFIETVHDILVNRKNLENIMDCFYISVYTKCHIVFMLTKTPVLDYLTKPGTTMDPLLAPWLNRQVWENIILRFDLYITFYRTLVGLFIQGENWNTILAADPRGTQIGRQSNTTMPNPLNFSDNCTIRGAGGGDTNDIVKRYTSDGGDFAKYEEIRREAGKQFIDTLDQIPPFFFEEEWLIKYLNPLQVPNNADFLTDESPRTIPEIFADTCTISSLGHPYYPVRNHDTEEEDPLKTWTVVRMSRERAVKALGGLETTIRVIEDNKRHNVTFDEISKDMFIGEEREGEEDQDLVVTLPTSKAFGYEGGNPLLSNVLYQVNYFFDHDISTDGRSSERDNFRNNIKNLLFDLSRGFLPNLTNPATGQYGSGPFIKKNSNDRSSWSFMPLFHPSLLVKDNINPYILPRPITGPKILNNLLPSTLFLSTQPLPILSYAAEYTQKTISRVTQLSSKLQESIKLVDEYNKFMQTNALNAEHAIKLVQFARNIVTNLTKIKNI